MPTYKVKGPDGRTVTLRGDTPPTEADLDGIFASLPPIKKPEVKRTGLMGGEVFGGLPSLVGGAKNAEDSLPMVGQMAGGKFGLAAAGGAAMGELARQGVKVLRGDTSGIKDPMAFGLGSIGLPRAIPSVGREAATTLAIEGLTRGLPRILFPKQFGGKAREVAGKNVGDLIEKVKTNAPFANTPKNPIISQIDEAFQANKFERGPAVQALGNAKKVLKGIKKPLSFEEAIQLERQLGRDAQFATDATQGHFAKAPKAPGLNKAIKGIRANVSAKVDEMAANAGVPEFEGASKEFAKLVRKYPESELQKMYSPIGMLIRGATMTSAGALPMLVGSGFNPVLGAIGGWASLPPKLKTAIFRKVVDSPIGKKIGRASTIGMAEMARRMSQS